MRFRAKLFLSLMPVVLIYIGTGIYLAAANAQVGELSQVEGAATTAVTQLYRVTSDTQALFVDANHNLGVLLAQWQRSRREFERVFTALQRDGGLRVLPDSLRRSIGQVRGQWADIHPLLDETDSLAQSVMKQPGLKILTFGNLLYNYASLSTGGRFTPNDVGTINRLLEVLRSFTLDIPGFTAQLVQVSEQVRASVRSSTSRVILLSVWLFALATATMILLMLRLSGRVSSRVRAIELIMARVAKRDLTARATDASGDEIGELGRHINRILALILEFVESVSRTSDHVLETRGPLAEASRESTDSVQRIRGIIDAMNAEFARTLADVSSATAAVDELANRYVALDDHIERQAMTIGDASAAIDEIARTITSVNRVTQERTAAAHRVMSIVSQGNSIVSSTNATIKAVFDEVQRVREVLLLIEDISDRTRILAMNAAIESAHAGTYGKGFAVVAGEIRTLADSTAANAVSIGRVLGAISERTQGALHESARSQEALASISSAMSEFVGAMQEISRNMSGLESGGRDILTAAAQSTDIARAVRDDSRRMRDETGALRDTLRKIEVVTRNVSNHSGSIHDSASDVATTVKSLVDASQEVDHRIEQLAEHIAGFQINA